jgi:hypothetical protein
MKVEGIGYLRQLRDRVNRGYDASREEAQRTKQIAVPVISDALQYLKVHRGNSDAQPAIGIDDHSTETTKAPESRIPDQTLNVRGSAALVVNASGQRELSNLGSARQNPIKVKRKLMVNSKTRESKRNVKPTDASETAREIPPTTATSAKFSDELDRITKNLTETRIDTGETMDNDADLLKWASDENSAIPQVLPFENLGDFRRVTSRRKSPIVASFLSDDEPSKEIKSAMDVLVAKYHTKAAFIYATSKSKEIARECRIKSYPTILVFSEGKVATELIFLNPEQLDRDLSKILATTSPANSGEDRERRPVPTKNEDDDNVENSRDGVRKLGVTDSL